jgi:NTE family protein
VRRIAADPVLDTPAPGVGLCLSGGGYRAMLFHTGSLWRLNDAGWLPRLDRISSVSGGSIVAAVLASRWHELGLHERTVAPDFERHVVAPVRRLASRTVDIPAVVTGMLLPGVTINDRLTAAYRRLLFGRRTLQALPERPELILNATSLQTGDLWRFSRRELGDWRVGDSAAPTVPLAAAVAASSAFPPLLSPSTPRLRRPLHDGSEPGVSKPPYTTHPVLTDGGVYDNLGLEAVWKRYRTVLVSDAGGHIVDDPRPSRFWGWQAVRILDVIDNQVRELRKLQAVTSYEQHTRDGAYWSIRSQVANFGLADPLVSVGPDAVHALAAIPTRLARLDDAVQERLINWGYAICDTALRRWVDPGAARPSALPYPVAELESS